VERFLRGGSSPLGRMQTGWKSAVTSRMTRRTSSDRRTVATAWQQLVLPHACNDQGWSQPANPTTRPPARSLGSAYLSYSSVEPNDAWPLEFDLLKNRTRTAHRRARRRFRQDGAATAGEQPRRERSRFASARRASSRRASHRRGGDGCRRCGGKGRADRRPGGWSFRWRRV
jgi:hypothetical protein